MLDVLTMGNPLISIVALLEFIFYFYLLLPSIIFLMTLGIFKLFNVFKRLSWKILLSYYIILVILQYFYLAAVHDWGY